MPHKISVLYIMGEGRSGSTILDQLLDSLEITFGTGELWSLFSDDADKTGNCSCGVDVDSCDFWSEVKRQYLQERKDESLVRSHMLRTKTDKFGSLLRQLVGFRHSNIKAYEDDTRSIYKVISEISNREVIIDSTKLVGRAFNLCRIKELDVHVVHLVRDGRGVVWSRLRDLKRDPSLKRHGPIESIINWVIKNAFGLIVGRLYPERYLRVRYEDLVANPEKEVNRIASILGASKIADSSILLRAGHQIGGNLSARTGKSVKKLKLDEEWKVMLPLRYKCIFRLLSFPILKKLGY